MLYIYIYISLYYIIIRASQQLAIQDAPPADGPGDAIYATGHPVLQNTWQAGGEIQELNEGL